MVHQKAVLTQRVLLFVKAQVESVVAHVAAHVATAKNNIIIIQLPCYYYYYYYYY